MSTGLNKACNLVIISQCLRTAFNRALFLFAFFFFPSATKRRFPAHWCNPKNTGFQRKGSARSLWYSVIWLSKCANNSKSMCFWIWHSCYLLPRAGSVTVTQTARPVKTTHAVLLRLNGACKKARAGSSIQISIGSCYCSATFLHGLWRTEAKNSPFPFPSSYVSGTHYVKSRLEPEAFCSQNLCFTSNLEQGFFFFLIKPGTRIFF